MKKKSISSMKKKCWTLFSEYIRTRDCLKTTGTVDEGRCVTCNRLYPFKQLQAGHFVPGRGNAVLWDERGVHAQCYGCNIGKKGNWIEYLEYMNNHYDKATVKELMDKRHEVKIMKQPQYEELYEWIKDKLENLMNCNEP